MNIDLIEELAENIKGIDTLTEWQRAKLAIAADLMLKLADELKECQAQRRAAFRRIEELDRDLDAMRAQQPLTDEQIQAMYDECDKKSDGGNEFMLMFARAIEAAHGIK